MYSSFALLASLLVILSNGSISAPIEEKSAPSGNLCTTTLSLVKAGLTTSAIKEKLISEMKNKAQICRGKSCKYYKPKPYGKPYSGKDYQTYDGYQNYDPYYNSYYNEYYDKDYYNSGNDYYQNDYYDKDNNKGKDYYSYSGGDDYYSDNYYYDDYYSDDYYSDDYYKNGCKGKDCKHSGRNHAAATNGPRKIFRSEEGASVEVPPPAVEEKPDEVPLLIEEFMTAIGMSEETPVPQTPTRSTANPLAILEKCSSTVSSEQPLNSFVSAVKQLVASFIL